MILLMFLTGPLKSTETMLKSFNVLQGLSPACDRYHTTCNTKLSIIMYDEIEERICKQLVSGYHLVY